MLLRYLGKFSVLSLSMCSSNLIRNVVAKVARKVLFYSVYKPYKFKAERQCKVLYT